MASGFLKRLDKRCEQLMPMLIMVEEGEEVDHIFMEQE